MLSLLFAVAWERQALLDRSDARRRVDAARQLSDLVDRRGRAALAYAEMGQARGATDAACLPPDPATANVASHAYLGAKLFAAGASSALCDSVGAGLRPADATPALAWEIPVPGPRDGRLILYFEPVRDPGFRGFRIEDRPLGAPNRARLDFDRRAHTALLRTAADASRPLSGSASLPEPLWLAGPESARPELTIAAEALAAIALGALAVGAGAWWAERRFAQAFTYLARIASAYARGRTSARARRLARLAPEIASLARAINGLADDIERRADAQASAVADGTALLQELHHRVKNNFAIIASLLGLLRKTVAPEQRADIRFIEEHVQVNAIVYRVAYAGEHTALVAVLPVVREVVGVLCDIADCRLGEVTLVSGEPKRQVDLDRAIALGALLAYWLPTQLDAWRTSAVARSKDGRMAEDGRIDGATPRVNLAVEIGEDRLVLRFSRPRAVVPTIEPQLRVRLIEAYLRQLGATDEIGGQTSNTEAQVARLGECSLQLAIPLPPTAAETKPHSAG